MTSDKARIKNGNSVIKFSSAFDTKSFSNLTKTKQKDNRYLVS